MPGPIYDAALRVYAGGGWPVTSLDDEDGFAMDVEGTDGSWTAFVVTDDVMSTFLFYSIAPVEADPADPTSVARVAEFTHRANQGLTVGTFEFDHDDGEVRLRTGFEFGTLPPDLVTPELLEAMVRDLSAANVGVMDRYLAGLVATTIGSAPVAEIIGSIERPEAG